MNIKLSKNIYKRTYIITNSKTKHFAPSLFFFFVSKLPHVYVFWQLGRNDKHKPFFVNLLKREQHTT